MAKQTKAPAAANAATPPDQSKIAQFDWSNVGVTGMENVKAEDLGIPFLAILQKGSPEVDETHKDFATRNFPGAKVGMIINSLNKEVLHEPRGEPMEFIPCNFQKAWVEWKPRNTGGGFVRSHADDSILREATRDDKNHDILRNGNMIVTTAYFFGFALRKEDKPLLSVISLTSTQLKKSRTWLNVASSIKLSKPDGTKFVPPLFSHRYFLSTAPESNAEGTWMGWKIDIAGPVKDVALINESVDLVKRITSGQQRLIVAPPVSSQPEGDVAY